MNDDRCPRCGSAAYVQGVCAQGSHGAAKPYKPGRTGKPKRRGPIPAPRKPCDEHEWGQETKTFVGGEYRLRSVCRRCRMPRERTAV